MVQLITNHMDIQLPSQDPLSVLKLEKLDQQTVQVGHNVFHHRFKDLIRTSITKLNMLLNNKCNGCSQFQWDKDLSNRDFPKFYKNPTE